MSFVETAKKDLDNLKRYYSTLDDRVRKLDLFIVIQVLLFTIAFLIVSLVDSLVPTVSNTAMMVYPLILAGYSFYLRDKIRKDSELTVSASKEFLKFFIIYTVLIIVTFIWGAILDKAIIGAN